MKMKVQKGWKDKECTIPKYVYISKINVADLTSNIFKITKNIKLENRAEYWYFTYDHRGYNLNPKHVYWLKNKPITIIKVG